MMWFFSKKKKSPNIIAPLDDLDLIDLYEANTLLYKIYEWTNHKHTEWSKRAGTLLEYKPHLERLKPQVTCIADSPDMMLSGSESGNAICKKGQVYDVDNYIWTQKAGWLISISGEFHKASDFT